MRRFKIGDLVEMISIGIGEDHLDSRAVGVVVSVIESDPNQAIRVSLCSGIKVWVAGYRLEKLS